MDSEHELLFLSIGRGIETQGILMPFDRLLNTTHHFGIAVRYIETLTDILA
jgi:hypothetical protein